MDQSNQDKSQSKVKSKKLKIKRKQDGSYKPNFLYESASVSELDQSRLVHSILINL